MPTRRESGLFVECTANEKEIERRLVEREGHPDEVSDAGVAVYQRQRDEFAALDEIPECSHLVIDTSGGTGSALALIRKRLVDLRELPPDPRPLSLEPAGRRPVTWVTRCSYRTARRTRCRRPRSWPR